jgi:ribosomal protein S18 acetylase RimI-like enzyme
VDAGAGHPLLDEVKAWERQVYQRLALPSRYVIVKQGEEMVGYGRSVQQGDILCLTGLWLLPDYRGQGLGTQLIYGLMQLGRNDGATISHLSVNEDNEGARRLYERLGFVNRYLYWCMVPAAEAD